MFKERKQQQIVFNALNSMVRFQMLKEIAKNEETTADQLMFITKLSQPTISIHLKILHQSDLIIIRREGRHMFISFNKPPLQEYINDLNNLILLNN